MDRLAIAAHAPAVAVRVYAAVAAHAVEMLGPRTASSAPAGTPAAPEERLSP